MRRVKFTVPGRAQPVGSKRAFPRKGGGVIVAPDNPRAQPWMAEAAALAATAAGDEAMTGALSLYVTFTLARPKGHYGTGRNSANLRPSAPPYPATRPDLTKLVRGLEDALTGALWRDDAQVVIQVLSKVYGWPERTDVVVEEVACP